MTLIAALPAWWLRVQLDELDDEHQAIVKLTDAHTFVVAVRAEPQWFWRLVPKSVAPNRECAVDVTNWGSDQSIQSNQMRLIARFSRLKRLILAHSAEISDEDLTAFGDMSELDTVCLLNCPRITERGLHNFSRSRRILHLNLNSTGVGDGCMEVIGRFRHLRSLALYGTNITDMTMYEVSRLADLTGLELPRGVTSKGLREITALGKLEFLDVWLHPGDEIEAVECVRELTALERLTVHGNGLTDAGLEIAFELPRLKQLHIYGGALSSSGFAALQGAPSSLKLHVDVCAAVRDDVGISEGFVGDPRTPPAWARNDVDGDIDDDDARASRRPAPMRAPRPGLQPAISQGTR